MTLPTAGPNFFAGGVIKDLFKYEVVFLKIEVLVAVASLHLTISFLNRSGRNSRP